ncbi:hypothetical protein F2P56_003910 [Juglans regia]|uniref:RRM domain-containing protein n=2 Tax=Juglans regia TaxID=51240 RepID=A0A833Y765_JUGRE|nr:RNA-binding protein Musashi homolog 2-like [Juglans regia]KAF5477259.1 hypothetical protein F2P56_003910 [Juglans regia]
MAEIPTTLNKDEFKDFFTQFGEVKEYQIMRDHSTNQSRGFGFIAFDVDQTVDGLLSSHAYYAKQIYTHVVKLGILGNSIVCNGLLAIYTEGMAPQLFDEMLEKVEEIALKLDWDGLLVIGGDDS